jgi:AcrR family transcriptional regulator
MPNAIRSRKPVDLRHTAGERRDEMIQAAVAEFAINGLHGTSTEMIARRIGISQPYIFRLFPSKKDLFIAAVDRCFDRVEATFAAAVRDPEPAGHQGDHVVGAAQMNPRLHAMGHAYVRLLAQRELVLFQMQAYAACSDEEVRTRVKQRWDQLMKLTAELSGASKEQLTLFFARGMLMNVVASIGLVPQKAADRWGHEVLGFA